MKKLFSIVLIALMSIVTLNAETTRIYCKMAQSWWTVDGAAVGCHSWGNPGPGTDWPGVRMTPVEGETDLWYIDLDTDNVQNVIFTRVNPSGAIADWGAKTKDLTIPVNGDNLFTITTSDESWGDPGCDGEWSKYVHHVITYKDTAYYVAGNFTNWAAEMKALPYEVELPADSVLEFKQVMLRTVLSDGDSIGKDTTWYGQANEGNYMTRESSAWTLDGKHNVLAVTDIAGKYVFSMNENGEFVITWPYEDLKYYVTGNAALVGEEKAWNERAIEMIDSTHTFPLLAAGEYQLKVTNGTWNNAYGFANLSEKSSSGISGDVDGNICFIVETPNDVVVSIANGKVTVIGIFKQPEPVETFDLTIVQDTLWTKDGGKVAAWIWGEELAGEWTAWATNVNDTLTLKVNEKADSIILVRCAPEAEVPTWEPWNRIDAGEIEDCHTFIITNWNEGVWCERPEPCEGQFGILVNETYIPAALNEERQDVVEYMLVDVELKVNDLVQIYDKCNETSWIITEYMIDSYQFHVTQDNKYIIQEGEADLYDFYFQLNPDKIYVGRHSDPMAVENVETMSAPIKFIENGEIRIRRGNQVYDVTGMQIR